MKTTPSDPQQANIFQEEMEALKVEREALFGFTDQDYADWTNAHNHKHKAFFMEQVKAAQEAAHTTVDELNDEDYDDDYKSNPIEDTDTVPFSVDKMDLDSGMEDGGSHATILEQSHHHHHQLSHLSRDGSSVHMVDVGHKKVTDRIAMAETRIVFPHNVWQTLTASSHLSSHPELVGPKGPILTSAKIAGIMAAKKTSDLIPLCHPLPINSVNINITLDKATRTARIECICKVTHKTGVEMEALTGASVAALVIYDMCKALSHDIVIESTRLIKKSGGRRDVNKIVEEKQ